jgi:hypothetical protein
LEDLNMRTLAFLTVALIAAAGAAQAQTPTYPSNAMPPMQPQQAQSSMGMGGCGHMPTITDEYGMRYDTEGNRLNARGCVIAPPVTQPGARAIQR